MVGNAGRPEGAGRRPNDRPRDDSQSDEGRAGGRRPDDRGGSYVRRTDDRRPSYGGGGDRGSAGRPSAGGARAGRPGGAERGGRPAPARGPEALAMVRQAGGRGAALAARTAGAP